MDGLVAEYGLLTDIKLYEERAEDPVWSGRKRRSASSSLKANSELEFEIPDIENASLKANYKGDLDDVGDAISKDHRYELVYVLVYELVYEKLICQHSRE